MKKDRLYTVDKGLVSVVQKQAKPKNVFAFGGQDNARWDRLASRAYGANYGDDGYTLDDYMNHKNSLGLSRQNNPFSKGNIGSTLRTSSSIIGAIPTGERRGMFDTLDPLHHLAGGRETGLGNAVGDAGVGLFQAGAQSGNGALMIAGAIAKGAGSLINAGWGTKKNEGNINAITQNTAQAREAGNMLTGASTTSDLINAAGNMTGSMGFGTTDLVKGGWFSKGKARRQGQKFLNKENAALAYQNQGMMLGANNVDSTLDNMVMGNFAAYGGPFEMASRMPYTEQNNSNDMGAIEYGFMSDYLINKQRQAEMKNRVGGINSLPANMFSDGGIEIKHPGRLTALKKRTGKTEAELWAEGKPEVRKMITFARNSRRWKKAYGGLIDAIDKIDTIEKNLFPYGGGTFSGSGAGGSWEDSTDTYPEVTNFNEAFDNAVKAGLKEFTFQGRRYNTQKELNPVREYNNRWVGQGRRSDVKNPSKAYDRQAGPLRGAEALVPIVVNTYTGAENPEFPPMLDYDPNATEQLTSPFRSYAWERPKTIKPKKALGGPLFAFGGNMGTNSADFSTGLTHIDAGQSHELNPNEGVQVGVDNEGTPNLVEEGEVIFNDYVFSNRIGIDDDTKDKFHIGKKREMTYAELAKKLEKEIAERPNDPISKASFKAQMEQLAEQQERQKQEMEAARAREAFEALSPEEQAGVMRYAQQQEQAAQEQAMQQEAMAQQAQMQQPSPEEMAMMEQQGQPEVMAQEPMIAAYGGRVNRFDDGGKMREKIYNLLGFHTDEDFLKWAREHQLRGDDKWEASEDMLKGLAEDDEAWKSLINDETFLDAISDRPALIDAIKKGYDFGAYTPSLDGKATFDNNRGNWDMQTVQGWWGSQDPAWLEVMKKHPEITKDTNLDKKTFEKYLSETEAFKKGTKWLQDSADNRLAYLQAIINNPEAPVKAKAYARKFADENGWLNGKEVDYNTIFNNPSGRAANPGTYWKTPLEAVRDAQTRNLVQNENGEWTDIIGDIPKEWSSIGNYSWATPSTDFTYNYYRRPGRTFHAVVGDDDYLPEDQSKWTGVGNEVRRDNLPNGDTVIYHSAAPDATQRQDTGSAKQNPTQPEGEGDIVPVHRNEKLRYVGLLGPAVGLGMQALGIGRPDTRGLDASLELLNNGVALADYKPIGNYLRYRPMDIWAEQNRLNANARATDRAIQNSGSNQGAKIAGLLSNEYNNQIGSGELYRKALEYNDALRERQATFNRGTDQFNAEAYNRTALQNAEMLNRNRQMRAQLGLDVARQKMAADAAWNQGIYGNVAGLFKGIGDVGRENYQHNRIADMAATGIFGTIDPDTSFIANGYLTRRKKEQSRGGKINRKKGGRK